MPGGSRSSGEPYSLDECGASGGQFLAGLEHSGRGAQHITAGQPRGDGNDKRNFAWLQHGA